MTVTSKLLLRCEFEIVEIDDETAAVSVGSDGNNYNGIILLKNESARFIFEKLKEGITPQELIKACMERYLDSSTEEVSSLIQSFLDMLKEKGLLTAVTQHQI